MITDGLHQGRVGHDEIHPMGFLRRHGGQVDRVDVADGEGGKSHRGGKTDAGNGAEGVGEDVHVGSVDHVDHGRH